MEKVHSQDYKSSSFTVATYNYESLAKLLNLFELKGMIVIVIVAAADIAYKMLKIVLRSRYFP